MKKALFPLYAAIFISTFGFASMITVFTPMILESRWNIPAFSTSLSIRLILLGSLLGLYPLGQFFGSPFLVHFSKRFGRKPVFIISLLITGIAYAGIASSIYFSMLPLLFLFILIAGVSESNLAIAECAISDIAALTHHRKLLTHVHVVWSSAYIFGPIAAAIFSIALKNPKIQIAAPFALIAVLLFLSSLYMAFCFQETRKGRPMSRMPAEKAFDHFLSAYGEKKMFSFYAANFFFYLSVFGFLRAYPIHLVEHFQLSIFELAQFIVFVAIPIIAADLWFVKWALKRFSTKNILIFASLTAAIFMLLLMFVTVKGFALWASLFIVAFAAGCCMPLCPFFISHLSRKEVYGEVLAHDESLRTGTEAFATLIVGFLAAVFISLPFIVFAIAAVVGTLLLVLKNK